MMKSVFITGAAQGLGKSLAAYFSKAGYYVYAGCHSKAAELPGPGEIRFGDISKEDDVKKLFEGISHLDVLINNARFCPSGRLPDIPNGEWFDRNLSVSLKGTYLCTIEAFRIMKQQGTGGSIINISSIRAHIPNDFDRIPYGAAKAGQLSLTTSFAELGGKHNIRVNALLPGAVATENLMKRISSERMAELKKTIPLGRPGEPDEFCHAAIFLAENTYTTGAFLNCSGGNYYD